LWRLPQNESTAAVAVRPVLLMHGLEASSRDWFDGLGAQALPYMLWRAGFDVWMGNNRGNFLSNRDCTIWNWTVFEMATYDLPRMIEDVLSTTGAESLSYVGHSQGTLQAFLHFSENPETASKILHFAALAPPVFMTMRSPTWKLFGSITDTSGGPWWKFQTINSPDFAVYEEIFQDQCRVLSFIGACSLYCGGNMGGSFMESHAGYATSCGDKFQCISAGTSAENMRYFAQALRLGSFEACFEQHGRPINFTSLQMPMSLAVGTSDLFISVHDVEHLRRLCNNGTVVDMWQLEGGGHMDLVWGKLAPSQVFEPLTQRLLAASTNGNHGTSGAPGDQGTTGAAGTRPETASSSNITDINASISQ